MEREVKNYMALWITVFVSLCYCHTIGRLTINGGVTTRLFAIFPIVSLFFYLPLTLSSLHLGSTTSFFIGWLATFKLLLFAFGKGPLSAPNISLPRFILLACLPINMKNHPFPPNSEKSLTTNTNIKQNPHQNMPKKAHKPPPLDLVMKISIVAVIFQFYMYEEYFHPKFMMLLYIIHIYIALELMLAAMAALARAMAGVELEPSFNEPYLSSSLQDFWGRRWNLIVSTLLRQTVYDPARSMFNRLIGKKWAPIPALLATFFVSGLMHEMIFYNVVRVKPTWEVMSFFLIHGVCLVAEICLKKRLNGKFKLPRIVAAPLVCSFVVVTSLWLLMMPSLRLYADEMARRETAAFVEFFKDVAWSIRFRCSKLGEGLLPQLIINSKQF